MLERHSRNVDVGEQISFSDLKFKMTCVSPGVQWSSYIMSFLCAFSSLDTKEKKSIDEVLVTLLKWKTNVWEASLKRQIGSCLFPRHVPHFANLYSISPWILSKLIGWKDKVSWLQNKESRVDETEYQWGSVYSGEDVDLTAYLPRSVRQPHVLLWLPWSLLECLLYREEAGLS